MKRLPALFMAASAAAGQAMACATCSGAMPQKTVNAYLGMILALSLLPFVLLGLGALAWRRTRHPSAPPPALRHRE